jgi:hypothetical protein
MPPASTLALTALPSTLALSAKIGRLRQEIPAIEEVYCR